MNGQVSNCCRAELQVSSSDEGTSFYVCSSCNKACDVYSPPIKWFVDSEEDKPYHTTTWYRCAGIENFVKDVEKTHKIVGITFEDNNIGFILDDEKKI